MDRFSLSVAHLELFGKKSEEGRPCGQATGFFYQVAGAVQLITNWHVVAGVDPTTMLPIDPEEPLPNAVRIFFKVSFTKEENGSGWLNTRSVEHPVVPCRSGALERTQYATECRRCCNQAGRYSIRGLCEPVNQHAQTGKQASRLRGDGLLRSWVSRRNDRPGMDADLEARINRNST